MKRKTRKVKITRYLPDKQAILLLNEDGILYAKGVTTARKSGLEVLAICAQRTLDKVRKRKEHR